MRCVDYNIADPEESLLIKLKSRIPTPKSIYVQERAPMILPTRYSSAMCLILFGANIVFAAESSARPDVGDDIPSYASTKCGGIDDGVMVGKTLCYTCRAGDEPIFYVFATQPSDSLARLVKQIETIVSDHKEKRTAGVVNFLGDPRNVSTRQDVAAFGKQHVFNQVSLTVTGDGSKFGLDDADEVTVILFEKGIIRLRNAVKPGQLDDKTIASIVRRSKSLLK